MPSLAGIKNVTTVMALILYAKATMAGTPPDEMSAHDLREALGGETDIDNEPIAVRELLRRVLDTNVAPRLVRIFDELRQRDEPRYDIPYGLGGGAAGPSNLRWGVEGARYLTEHQVRPDDVDVTSMPPVPLPVLINQAVRILERTRPLDGRLHVLLSPSWRDITFTVRSDRGPVRHRQACVDRIAQWLGVRTQTSTDHRTYFAETSTHPEVFVDVLTGIRPDGQAVVDDPPLSDSMTEQTIDVLRHLQVWLESTPAALSRAKELSVDEMGRRPSAVMEIDGGGDPRAAIEAVLDGLPCEVESRGDGAKGRAMLSTGHKLQVIAD